MPAKMRAVQLGEGWSSTLINVLLDQTVWTVVINIVRKDPPSSP